MSTVCIVSSVGEEGEKGRGKIYSYSMILVYRASVMVYLLCDNVRTP